MGKDSVLCRLLFIETLAFLLTFRVLCRARSVCAFSLMTGFLLRRMNDFLKWSCVNGCSWPIRETPPSLMLFNILPISSSGTPSHMTSDREKRWKWIQNRPVGFSWQTHEALRNHPFGNRWLDDWTKHPQGNARKQHVMQWGISQTQIIKTSINGVLAD